MFKVIMSLSLLLAFLELPCLGAGQLREINGWRLAVLANKSLRHDYVISHIKDNKPFYMASRIRPWYGLDMLYSNGFIRNDYWSSFLYRVESAEIVEMVKKELFSQVDKK